MSTVLSFIGYFFIACMLAFIPAMIITSVFIKRDNNVKEFLVVLVICALAFELYDQPYKDKKEEKVTKSTAVYEGVEDEYDDYEKEPEETFYYKTYSSNQVYKDGLESDGKIHVYLVGSGETVQAKNSSSIKSMTYYDESDHLIINFNGKEYVYANVSSSIWKSFKEAKSSDTFYDTYLKGDKSHWINDYNGKNGDLIVLEHVGSNNQSTSSTNSYSLKPSINSQQTKPSNHQDYEWCDVCEMPYSYNEVFDVDGENVCMNCLENGDYAWCEGCGEPHCVEFMYYYGDGYICESCMEADFDDYGGYY